MTLLVLNLERLKIFGNQASTLSTNDLSLENNIQIYPNPAHEYFKINLCSKQIKIYNLLGKLVQTHKGKLNTGYRYNISSLEPGVYLISVVTERGKMTRKLIKY